MNTILEAIKFAFMFIAVSQFMTLIRLDHVYIEKFDVGLFWFCAIMCIIVGVILDYWKDMKS